MASGTILCHILKYFLHVKLNDLSCPTGATTLTPVLQTGEISFCAVLFFNNNTRPLVATNHIVRGSE